MRLTDEEKEIAKRVNVEYPVGTKQRIHHREFDMRKVFKDRFMAKGNGGSK